MRRALSKIYVSINGLEIVFVLWRGYIGGKSLKEIRRILKSGSIILDWALLVFCDNDVPHGINLLLKGSHSILPFTAYITDW